MDSRRWADWLVWLSVALPSACACTSGQTGSPAIVSGGAGSGGVLPGPPPDAALGGGGSGGGPIGSAECLVDADCIAHLTDWTRPLATSVTLVSSRCAHVDASQDPLPVCQCTLRVQSTADATPFDTTLSAGARGFPYERGCSEYGRVGDCLYCAGEFPGCHLESPEASCTGVCEDLVQRVAEAWLATYAVNVRVARCSDYHCQRVVEIDGRCFVGEVLPDSAAYDCSLSDEELLALGPAEHPLCPPGPVHTCVTAADCPAGLACKDGACDPCSAPCSAPAPDGGAEQCPGGGECASGETCTLNLCVPSGSVGCESNADCGTDQACALSGVDFAAIRGTDTTVSLCVATPVAP